MLWRTRRCAPRTIAGAALNLIMKNVASAVTATGLLIVLAATIDATGPPAGGPGASLVVRLPDAVRIVVLALLALSVIIMLALQRRDRRRPIDDEVPALRRDRRLPPWLAALLSFPVALSVVALVYMIWSRSTSDGDEPITAALDAIRGLLDLLARSRKPDASLVAFDVAVAVLAVAAALVMFTAVLLVAFAEHLGRRDERDAPRRLVGAIAESLDDLRDEPDARRAIVRAYRRFERALAASDAPRAPWQTPSEFMHAIVSRLAVPRRPVERLTALFEVACFSDRHLGLEARDAACDCLDEIRTALEGQTGLEPASTAERERSHAV